ncbi:hypothetical protein [Streptomyces sp. NPDC088258]|uniref:hypothetical protein n=1 Tax=Streptomyces sp. NPDC088258 TaxID=3365849 RepID=UPI003809751C
MSTSTLAYTQAIRPEDPDAEYLTIQEFAYVMNCSPRTLRRRVKAGMPHTRQKGTRRIQFSRKDRELWRRFSEAGERRRAIRIAA